MKYLLQRTKLFSNNGQSKLKKDSVFQIKHTHMHTQIHKHPVDRKDKNIQSA